MSETIKTKKRIDDATIATIFVLNCIREGKPDLYIPKAKLFPRIIARITDIIEESDDLVYDELAISAPDDSFLWGHWGKITRHAAKKYKKYIVWDRGRNGVKLGTFEEYQTTQDYRVLIIKGSIDVLDTIAHIITSQGGASVTGNFEIKYLSSGEEDSKE